MPGHGGGVGALGGAQRYDWRSCDASAGNSWTSPLVRERLWAALAVESLASRPTHEERSYLLIRLLAVLPKLEVLIFQHAAEVLKDRGVTSPVKEAWAREWERQTAPLRQGSAAEPLLSPFPLPVLPEAVLATGDEAQMALAVATAALQAMGRRQSRRPHRNAAVPLLAASGHCRMLL